MKEEPRIALLGKAGSFHEQAACHFFLSPFKAIRCDSFDEMFSALRSGAADFMVIAIENSIHGKVSDNLSQIAKSQFDHLATYTMSVDLCLAGFGPVKLETIKRLFSHPVAFSECAQFLKARGNFELVDCSDTASAALMVSEEKRLDTGAICSKMSAELNKLSILQSRVQDRKHNYTTFALLGA